MEDPELAAIAVREELRQKLASLRPSSIEVNDGSVEFTSRLFRAVPNRNLLAPVGRGRFELQAGTGELRVRYRISFAQLVVVVSVLIGVVSVPVVVGAMPMPLMFLAFGWCWLVGANVVISITRFHGFVHRCATDVLGTPEAIRPVRVSSIIMAEIVVLGTVLALSYSALGLLPALLGGLAAATALALLTRRRARDR